ncbi:AbrB family transcriptional regulator [Acetobacteraceae bacterium]|nr:AbrB family transcriptional regulator [Acetobacteraceae bacterium]
MAQTQISPSTNTFHTEEKPHSLFEKWAFLLILSIIFTLSFFTVHLGAGLMLGPMLAAVFCAVTGRHIKISRPFFNFAQAVLGALVVGAISATAMATISQHLWIVLFFTFSVIIVSLTMGATLTWRGVVPGTTALWGSSPGGASTMVAICGDFGADPKVAAFMLYFRVALVAFATSLVTYFALPNLSLSLSTLVKLSHELHFDLWSSLGLIAFGTALTLVARIPAVSLLSVLIIGVILKSFGLCDINAPYWLRVPAYTIIGWSIGMRFTKPVLKHVIRILPSVALSAGVVVGACALLSFPLAKLANIDLLSAYLATSPGGLDTIIIISAGAPVNLPIILALQTARMIAVLIVGPALAKPLGRWLEKHAAKPLTKEAEDEDKI